MPTSSSSSKSKPNPPQSRDEYTIGIVCALQKEAVAVQSAFDYLFLEEDEMVETADGDENTYSFGTMGNRHVVLVHLGEMGGLEAKEVASNMHRSFRNIRLCLVVGICGIIPKIDNEETLLGDVIISNLVKQYDRGKEYPVGFQETNMLGPASLQLRRAFNSLGPLQMRHLSKRLKECLLELNEHEDTKALEYEYPGYRLDYLYDPDYVHEHRDGTCSDCRDKEYCKPAVDTSCTQLECSSEKFILRNRMFELEQLTEDMQGAFGAQKLDLSVEYNKKILPKIFLGAVASGNKVMKNGKMRDDVAAEHNIIAFEMEGAGVWSSFPTVVIKAGCDYGDSHKNKKFQKYASMTAAACAKAFLSQLQMGIPRNVEYGAGDVPRQTQQDQQAQREPLSNDGRGGTVNYFNGTFTGNNIGMGETYNAGGNMYIGGSTQNRGRQD